MKRLIILRLDGIGDYILFRNYLRDIRMSSRFKGFEITFCGNIQYKKIAEYYDDKYIDKFIWIDTKRLSNHHIYRKCKLLQLSYYYYDFAISAVYTRNYYFGDDLIRIIRSGHKIGMYGQKQNISDTHYEIGNKYYHELFDTNHLTNLFEFHRNRLFVEFVISEKSNTFALLLDEQKNIQKHNKENNTIYFSIGASMSEKKWKTENIVEFIRLLLDSTNYNIQIVYDKSDITDAKYIARKIISAKLSVGNYDIIKLIRVIEQAVCLMAFDTGIAHLSMALNVKTVMLCRGTELGRYNPYPADMKKNALFLYPSPVYLDNDALNYEKYKNSKTGESLSLLNPEHVLQHTLTFLDEKL